MEKTIHSAQYAVFLNLLRRARKDAGLTQEDAARLVGETQSFVSKVERGERRLDVVELRTFCRAFGVRLQDFIADFEKAVRRTAARSSASARRT